MSLLVTAFSPRENLRHLIARPRDALPQLDGLRALAVLWVIGFHAFFFGYALVPRIVIDRIRQTTIGGLVWRGDYGVDVFFVLSGFLIGRMVFDERDATGRLSLPRFYLRRAMRLFPAYWIVLFACVVFFPDMPAISSGNTFVWNLAYLNNFVTVTRQTMAWAWSLAIEEQFYLVFPWIVLALGARQPRTRIVTLLVMVPVGALIASAIAAWCKLDVADIDLTPDGDVTRWARAFDLIYDKPYTRFGALFVGVTAHLLDRTNFVPRMIEWPIVSTLGAVVAVLLISGAVSLGPAAGRPRVVEVLALGGSRTAFAVGVGYLLLLSLSPHPLGRLIGWFLGLRVFRPIAQLAYSAYLVNPICAIWFGGNVGLPRSTHPVPFLLYCAIMTLATLALATVLYVFVERPVMTLRPRGGRAPDAQP